MTTWTTMLETWIPGVPAPQGSMTAFPMTRVLPGGKRVAVMNRKTGFPVVEVKASNEKLLKAWRKQVTSIAMDAWGGREPLDEEVAVLAVFTFNDRPATHHVSNDKTRPLKATASPYKTTAPDTDKLSRALLDGLADGGVLANDARVCRLVAEKVYGPAAGVRVWIQTIKAERELELDMGEGR